MRYLRLPRLRVLDEEVAVDDSPPHAWPDDETDLTREQIQEAWDSGEPVDVITPATLDERGNTYHSERTYLLQNSSADPLFIQGPVEERVRVGDIILAYVRDQKQQWACQVDKIHGDLSADVTRV